MIGIDEVGRGSWAGPLLVVAARQLSTLPAEIKDSKLLINKQRKDIAEVLKRCCEFGEGWVDAAVIDSKGLSSAMKIGTARALRALRVTYKEEIIIDGSINYVSSKFYNSSCVISADALIPLVSAASIYAKVARDEIMQELGLKYPDYGFENHVGYGTKAHQLALKNYGVLKNIHRLSYKPVRSFTL